MLFMHVREYEHTSIDTIGYAIYGTRAQRNKYHSMQNFNFQNTYTFYLFNAQHLELI